MASAARVVRKLDRETRVGEKSEESRATARKDRLDLGLEWDDLTQEQKLEESDRRLSWTVKLRYSHFMFIVASLFCSIMAVSVEGSAGAGVLALAGIVLFLLGIEASLFTMGGKGLF
jgi:hypothetical protein